MLFTQCDDTTTHRVPCPSGRRGVTCLQRRRRDEVGFRGQARRHTECGISWLTLGSTPSSTAYPSDIVARRRFVVHRSGGRSRPPAPTAGPVYQGTSTEYVPPRGSGHGVLSFCPAPLTPDNPADPPTHALRAVGTRMRR